MQDVTQSAQGGTRRPERSALRRLIREHGITDYHATLSDTADRSTREGREHMAHDEKLLVLAGLVGQPRDMG